MTLHETMRRYPGGIAALADRVGVSRRALYDLAEGRHKQEPRELLERVHTALLAAAHVPSQRQLRAMWRKAHEAGHKAT